MATAAAHWARVRWAMRHPSWLSLMLLWRKGAGFSTQTLPGVRTREPSEARTAAHCVPSASTVAEAAGPFEFASITPFWQQEPVVIRRAFPVERSETGDSWPYFTWDDILSLAMDDETGESARLIRHIPGQLESFDLELGPFDKSVERRFSQTSREDSSSGVKQTILVNDVDRYIPRLADWMDDCFLHQPRHGGNSTRWPLIVLPRWRRDDAQVSLAHAGGGIGPHVDQYDVLLIQVRGRREWLIDADDRLSMREEVERLIPDISVRILQQPSLELNERTYTRIVLEAGDCLYLPPHVIHWGTAVSDLCITLSVGFRAPSASDIVAQVAETMAESLSDTTNRRFTDASVRDETSIQQASFPSLDVSVKDQMKTLVIDAVQELMSDSLLWDEIVGKLVTRPLRYSESLDLIDETTAKKTLDRVARGKGALRRAPGISFATSRVETSDGGHTDRLFAAGQCWQLTNDSHALEVFTCIENGESVSSDVVKSASIDLRQVLEGLLTEGMIHYNR